jgi:hypothetical protein
VPCEPVIWRNNYAQNIRRHHTQFSRHSRGALDVYTPVQKEFTFYARDKDDANFQGELAVVGV